MRGRDFDVSSSRRWGRAERDHRFGDGRHLRRAHAVRRRDELQGIKRGVLEIADMIAVNKADGDNVKRARLAAADYRRAIHLMTPASPNWTPPVLTCSALTNDGLPELWEQIVAHREKLTATGERAQRRQRQQIGWMWSLIGDRLLDEFRASGGSRAARAGGVGSGRRFAAGGAADRLLATFLSR